MEKCRLCLNNVANETGSHTVPAFILKTLFPRDKEMVFTIKPRNITANVGRAVLPEAVKEFVGKELTDEEIAANKIPFIEDYIFCKSCEKRLGHLESRYADVIQKQLNKQANTGKSEILKMKEKSFLVSLFWYSVIWRCSVSSNYLFNLQNGDEEILRAYLNENLFDSSQNLLSHIDSKPNECLFPLAVFFYLNSENDSSNVLEPNSEYFNPYILHINEYILILYVGDAKTEEPLNDYIGLEKDFMITELINSKDPQEFLIGIVSIEIWQEIKINIYKDRAETQIRHYGTVYKNVADYYRLPCDDEDIRKFVKSITDGDMNYAEKYSEKRRNELLKVSLKELIIRNSGM